MSIEDVKHVCRKLRERREFEKRGDVLASDKASSLHLLFCARAF